MARKKATKRTTRKRARSTVPKEALPALTDVQRDTLKGRYMALQAAGAEVERLKTDVAALLTVIYDAHGVDSEVAQIDLNEWRFVPRK